MSLAIFKGGSPSQMLDYLVIHPCKSITFESGPVVYKWSIEDKSRDEIWVIWQEAIREIGAKRKESRLSETYFHMRVTASNDARNIAEGLWSILKVRTVQPEEFF